MPVRDYAVNDKANDQYRIEARSLDILGGAAGHSYWVLRGPDDRVLAEMHGLATNRRTGEFEPMGFDEKTHSLRAWHFPHTSDIASRYGATQNPDSFFVEGQQSATVATGSKEEILARWDTAVQSIEKLNKLDLDYPSYGFNLASPTVNSNSTFRTLGEIMSVKIPDFPAKLEPGLDNRMLPADEIEKIKYQPTHNKSVKLDATMQKDLGTLRTGTSNLHGFDESQRENIAAGLLAACAANPTMKRVDSTLLGRPLPDGSQNLIARYSPWGNAGSHHMAHVEINEAAATPAEQHIASAVGYAQQNQSIADQQHAIDQQRPYSI